MRRQGETYRQITEHRGHKILLSLATSRFHVEEVGEIDVATLNEAKNAIDRHIAAANKGVRRKVLTWEVSYHDDKPRTIKLGELTSWTRGRGYRGASGIVSYGGHNREELSPDHIFENTPANRATLEKIVGIERDIAKAKKAIEKLEESLERAKQPEKVTSIDKAEE